MTTMMTMMMATSSMGPILHCFEMLFLMTIMTMLMTATTNTAY